MLIHSIHHNLEFLQAEVVGRLESLKDYLQDTSPDAAERIFNRSGYLSNLKQRIHTDCYRCIAEAENADAPEVIRIRETDIIATELERIADLGADFTQQLLYCQDPGGKNFPRFATQIDLIIESVSQVQAALADNDTATAVRIGRVQSRLDRKFRKLLKKNAAALRDTSDAEKLLTIALGAYAIEHMGDSLLRISEAIISSSLGMSMDTTRFQGMQDSLSDMTASNDPLALRIRNVADTRSGAGISAVQLPDEDNNPYPAILKQGQTKKLKMERKGVQSWHDTFPGLAPQILAWKKQGKSATLLIEHLSGLTFEQIVLNEPDAVLQAALTELKNTLYRVWGETRSEQATNAAFMGQLHKRLGDVYAVHPEFQDQRQSICGQSLPSFRGMTAKANTLEQNLPAPFSVYIHGDFNIDNILYNEQEQQLHYVDLHRSRQMDYVQDVSVFMVSNYRLQVLDAAIRERIGAVICQFYRIARHFAHKQSDDSFEIRLALGLVRSLATSTRFILDRNLARGMFMRAHYLLEQIVRLKPKHYAGYQVPVAEIFHG